MPEDVASRYLFTPPNIEPLNLDLAELSGGGECPSQYYGKTHDGRDVYCRYRGGSLSVDVGDVCLLDAHIGPPLHGSMPLAQLCHLAGLTIGGDRPPMPDHDEMRANGWEDLSGATTFFFSSHNSTMETARRVVREFQASMPNGCIVDSVETEPTSDPTDPNGGTWLRATVVPVSIESLNSSMTYLMCGDYSSERYVRVTQEGSWLEYLFPRASVFHVHFQVFKGKIYKYGDTAKASLSAKQNRNIRVAGQDDECLHATFSVHSQFPTADETRRGLELRFGDLLDTCFPRRTILAYHMDDGRRFPGADTEAPLDPRIAEWIEGGEDRWLHLTNKGTHDDPVFVGLKPGPLVSS
ncbi:MAG: hypothetical protein KDA49_00355 [Rhodospirillaceae bacterium]|nr:hypothetical protein [Rhodospirillaceae bacterium]